MPNPRPFALPLALAALIVLAACTTTDGADLPGPLQVTAYAPTDGAVGVAIDAAVTATFDRAVDRTSVEGAFALTGPDGAVAGDLALDAAGTGATFVPTAALAPGATYTASLAGSVAAVDGGALAGAVAWTFTTVAASEPEPEPEPLVLTGDLTWSGVATVNDPALDLRPQVTGGVAPITFHVDGDLPPVVTHVPRPLALPAGVGGEERYAIEVDPATGAITGRTPVPGLFTGSIVATDARGTTASLNYALNLTLDFESLGPSTLVLDHREPIGHVDVDPGLYLVGGVPLSSFPPSVARAFDLDTDEPVEVVPDSGAIVRTASVVTRFNAFPTVLTGTIAGFPIEPVELALDSTGPYINQSGTQLFTGAGGTELPAVRVGRIDVYSPPRAGDHILVVIGHPVGDDAVPVPVTAPTGWSPVVVLSPPEPDPLATRFFLYEVDEDDEGEEIFFDLPGVRTDPVNFTHYHLRNAAAPRLIGATVKADGATVVTAPGASDPVHARPYGARFVFVEAAVEFDVEPSMLEEGVWLGSRPQGSPTRGYVLFGLEPLGAEGEWKDVSVPIDDGNAYAAMVNLIVGGDE